MTHPTNNKINRECCRKFHEEGIETGIDFINVECGCPCHSLPSKEESEPKKALNMRMNAVLENTANQSTLPPFLDTTEKECENCKNFEWREGVRPFKCIVCNKIFSSPSNIESWEERFEKIFSNVGNNSFKNEFPITYDVVKYFLRKEIAASYKRGREAEAKSWMYQKANEHDARIRAGEREKIRQELRKKAESSSIGMAVSTVEIDKLLSSLSSKE